MNSRLHSSCRSRLATLFVATLVVACSGGGGGGGASAVSGITDFTMQDAPSDELLSFSATVSDLRLVMPGGGTTADLLPGDLTFEFLGLQTVPAWLARVPLLPAGTYTGVRLTFVPGSVTARDNNGADVAVTVSGSVLDAAFAVPVTLGGTSYSRVSIDLDLATSLTGSTTAPPLLFDPRGSSIDDNGGVSGTIDEIRGVVLSNDSSAQSLVIDAFADDDLLVPLGEVTVTVSAGTLLLDDDDLAYPTVTAFFSALIDGSTLIEAHGALVLGRVSATRIEVEDHSGGTGTEDLVKIRGLVTNLGPGSGFDLLIGNIEKGAAIANPVLTNLGNPAVIAVSYDVTTLFLLDSHTPTTSAALSVGQEVEVKFPAFVNPPFFASQVELEDGPEFEGRITDTSGLPDSVIMHVFSSEPSVISGQIASGSTDVIVDLTGSTLFLDTDGKPTLQKSQLLAGLKFEVHGVLSGLPTAPTITATKSKVHAGRLRGVVTSITPALSSFSVAVGSLDDPFGHNVTSPPFTVDLAPGCVFEKDASSATSFFALFSNLQIGQELEVEVNGIGSGFPDEILVYELEAEVD